MNTNVAIVIVSWNAKEQTAICLSSLEKLEKTSIHVQVVLVDNASADGTKEYISKKFPQTHIISLDRNLGFTGGNNAGISYALHNGADYIWLLNNDTIVDRRSVVSILDAFTSDKTIGIAGSKIYFAPGFEYHKARYEKKDKGKIFWYAGGIIDWDNMYCSHRGVDKIDTGQFDTLVDTAFVTGCSMMVAASVFKKVGVFDDKYYLYLEDVDFCLRARFGGFRVVYEPTSIVWHFNAQSSGGPGSTLHTYYLTRNRLLLGFRYASVRTKFALLRQALAMTVSKNISVRSAVVDALLGRFGPGL